MPSIPKNLFQQRPPNQTPGVLQLRKKSSVR
jgi:hypothetical protein